MMTLEEKFEYMATGEPYNDLDSLLIKERELATEKTNQLNSVVIMLGITIGDNTIIGAGSVVIKDIPANVITAGNPCRVIRKITDKDKTGFDPSDSRFI